MRRSRVPPRKGLPIDILIRYTVLAADLLATRSMNARKV
jgi:hypothetical protein